MSGPNFHWNGDSCATVGEPEAAGAVDGGTLPLVNADIYTNTDHQN